MLSITMSAILSPVQTVIDLFATELTDVRFGDVDARTLAAAAEELRAAADVVASAEARLAEARSDLREREEQLLQHAQRALAYARVYAEANADLSARLDAISLPRASRRSRPEVVVQESERDEQRPASRPRGRPRKSLVDSAAAAAE
jgi:hypothetical protein